ncbi:aminotransferase class III-fold pyridoxal phosphate-dependent enzyme [Vagococcus sp. JNUCC 83]
MTLAKGLGNGLPVGAMLAKESIASSFTPGSHGSTFGGNRLALSVAEEVISTISNPLFLNHVQAMEDVAFSFLSYHLANQSNVLDIRGKGLMIGIELSENVSDIIEILLDKGLAVLQAGPRVIRLLPPLIITKEELKEGLSILVEVIQTHK